MKVSVVIPVYNEEKRIKNCLDSLLEQNEKPDEIIVVDNNSTDNTVSIVKKYKGINLVHEKKQGITPTRNKGFNTAKYDIIARCDADTIVPPNWIKAIKEDLTKDDSIVAISNPACFYDVPLINKSVFPFYLYLFIPKIIVGYYPLIGVCMTLKKTVWEKVKGELCQDDKKVHEDIDLSFHIIKFGKIYHDSRIIAKSSGRRLKNNPSSFLGEYTLRFFKMLYSHRHLVWV